MGRHCRPPTQVRSAIEWRDIAAGAQTERRGGAGPVGGLLGGKDPTGRYVLSRSVAITLPGCAPGLSRRAPGAERQSVVQHRVGRRVIELDVEIQVGARVEIDQL